MADHKQNEDSRNEKMNNSDLLSFTMWLLYYCSPWKSRRKEPNRWIFKNSFVYPNIDIILYNTEALDYWRENIKNNSNADVYSNKYRLREYLKKNHKMRRNRKTIYKEIAEYHESCGTIITKGLQYFYNKRNGENIEVDDWEILSFSLWLLYNCQILKQPDKSYSNLWVYKEKNRKLYNHATLEYWRKISIEKEI